jgi:hypothetical protein
MTSIRRAVVLLSTTTAVLFGAVLPADAQLGDSASTPTMAITTVDVQAPTNLSTAGTKCDTTWNGWTWVTTLHAKVSWRASTTTRGVTGYRVVAHVNGFPYPIQDVPAGVTSLTGDYDASVTSNTITVTVTTLTSYGWTEESAQSGVIKC